MIKRKLPPPNPTLGDAVREFLEDRRAKGTAATTCETYDRKLRLLFIDVLDQRLNEMDYPEVRSRLVRIADALATTPGEFLDELTLDLFPAETTARRAG